MKRLALLLFCLFLPLQTQAHHGSHGGSSGTRTLLFQGNQTKNASRVFFLYDFAKLDNSVGESHTFNLGIEASVHSKWSVLAQLPIAHLSHNFRPDATGPGDVGIGLKYLLWEGERGFLTVSDTVSLPTGEKDTGLGRGSVAQQIDLFGGLTFNEWTLFAAAGVNHAFDSPVEPIAGVIVGANTPVVYERFYFTLAANTQIFIRSDVFENASFKIFIEPQANWIVDKAKHLTFSVTGRISAVDELSRKSGIGLASTDNALLNDIQWGVATGFNYDF